MKLPLLSYKKIRNTTGFYPASLLGLTLWLDAADTGTIAEDEISGAVSQWDDKSGEGFNVIQTTGSDQPISGINTINGLNVIQFDGANDVLLLDPFIDFTTVTVFVVAEQEFGNRQCLVDINNSAATNTGIIFFYSFGENLVRVFLDPDIIDIGISESLPAKHIFTATVSLVDVKYYQDGVLKDSVLYNGGLKNVLSRIDIGQLRNLDVWTLSGPIGEIIIYNRSLLDSERISIELYLSEKWGIAL